MTTAAEDDAPCLASVISISDAEVREALLPMLHQPGSSSSCGTLFERLVKKGHVNQDEYLATVRRLLTASGALPALTTTVCLPGAVASTDARVVGALYMCNLCQEVWVKTMKFEPARCAKCRPFLKTSPLLLAMCEAEDASLGSDDDDDDDDDDQ